MAEKENNVLNYSFLNFDLYVNPDSNFSDLNIKLPENFSGILLITNVDTISEKIPDEYTQLLSKICQSVGLEMGSETIVLNIMPSRQIRFIDLVKNLKISRIIVFGPTPEELGIYFSISPYKIAKWNNIELLFVDSVEKIHSDINRKKQLWRMLKQLFLT